MTHLAYRRPAQLLPAVVILAAALIFTRRAAAAPEDPTGAVVQLSVPAEVQVYAAPDATSRVVTMLEPSDVVYLVGYARSADLTLWYNVAHLDGAALGWVMAGNLQILNVDIDKADAQLAAGDMAEQSPTMVEVFPPSPEPNPGMTTPAFSP